MHIALIRSYGPKPWRSPATFDRIEESLRQRWAVTAVETIVPAEMLSILKRLQRTHYGRLFVFNIAEYLNEERKTGFLPALLDAWRLPHLGSTAAVVRAGLSKPATKRVLMRKGIPTPRFVLALHNTLATRALASAIGYPLIVKPSAEGGHIGISDQSIVHGPAELSDAIARILTDFKQPALIESYITGAHMREFSVGVIDGPQRLFAPIEIDYAAMPVGEKILSYEAAQQDAERIKEVSDLAIHDQICALASRTFDAMGARDYARVDLRMDDTDCYVLEINIMPGLGPHSFLPEAAQRLHGLSYSQLIEQLTMASMGRQR